jgi:hypothetical protein
VPDGSAACGNGASHGAVVGAFAKTGASVRATGIPARA